MEEKRIKSMIIVLFSVILMCCGVLVLIILMQENNNPEIKSEIKIQRINPVTISESVINTEEIVMPVESDEDENGWEVNIISSDSIQEPEKETQENTEEPVHSEENTEEIIEEETNEKK